MPAIQAITEHYHVCPQLQAADVGDLARAGYTTLVCMRPDDEVPDQPRCSEIAAAARAHGLDFHWIPAPSGAVSQNQAADLRRVVAEARGRVLSYCASGRRCALAWQLAQALLA